MGERMDPVLEDDAKPRPARGELGLAALGELLSRDDIPEPPAPRSSMGHDDLRVYALGIASLLREQGSLAVTTITPLLMRDLNLPKSTARAVLAYGVERGLLVIDGDRVAASAVL